MTLTYRTDALPKGGSLDVRAFQLFMKRLRKRFSTEKVRFFHCGEYGEKFGRPHYHACLFNFYPEDALFYSRNNGNTIYTSKVLDEVWGNGQVWIGEVTFESAAYVARYIMKKVTGERAEAHYGGRAPEYTTMSRGGRGKGSGGIGKAWFDRWKGDVYSSDSVVMRGKEMRPPKFYDREFEKGSPVEFGVIKSARVSKARLQLARDPDSDARRRGYQLEAVKRAQVRSLSRKLEV